MPGFEPEGERLSIGELVPSLLALETLPRYAVVETEDFVFARIGNAVEGEWVDPWGRPASSEDVFWTGPVRVRALPFGLSEDGALTAYADRLNIPLGDKKNVAVRAAMLDTVRAVLAGARLVQGVALKGPRVGSALWAAGDVTLLPLGSVVRSKAGKISEIVQHGGRVCLSSTGDSSVRALPVTDMLLEYQGPFTLLYFAAPRS